MFLHENQKIIARDTHRFRVINCGRRFGKTTLAVEEIKACAISKPTKIAYIAPTFSQARDIAWQLLLNEVRPIAKRINETRLELEVLTQNKESSFIFLRGWEAVETLRGQAFDLIVIDEIAMMRNWWVNWQEVLRPALTDTKGSVMFISTPKGFNHFYDLYNLELKDKDYKSFNFTSYDNPFLDPEEIDTAKTQMTEDRFAQEYMADFRKTEGLVYKEFDRKRHLFENRPTKVIERLGGVDFGFTNPAAVLTIEKDDDNNYWVVDEWYKRGRTEVQIAEYTASCKFNRVYPDPENPSAIQVLNDKGVSVVEVVKGKDSIKSGINRVRELFKQNRLFIHNSCSNLINELEVYSYPDKKPDRPEEEKPIAEYNHALDALRYVMLGQSITTQRDTTPMPQGEAMGSDDPYYNSQQI